jgi:hypothetical protein
MTPLSKLIEEKPLTHFTESKIYTTKTSTRENIKKEKSENFNPVGIFTKLKAHSKPHFKNIREGSNSKSEVRKLLVINSPDSQEVKNSEKCVIESINKAIKDENFEDQKSKKREIKETIKIASIGLGDSCKTKIRAIIKELSSNISNMNTIYFYTGETYSDLEESELVIIKNSSNFNFYKEFKTLYIHLLNNFLLPGKKLERKFIRFNYFLDCEKKKKFLNFDSYLLKFSFDLENIDKMRHEDNSPLKGYKVFLFPSESPFLDAEEEDHKHEVMERLITLLGGKLVNHIRLSDLCIINRVESSQYFPPHVRNLNYDFIFDTLISLKLPELDSFKYKPKDAKYKKNRK